MTDVTDQDRLAEIKDTLRYWDGMHGPYGPAPRPPAVAAQEAARHVNRAQIDWLIDQAELAKELGDLLPQKINEVERLRGQHRLVAAELLLARAVIHELAWGDVVITDHPRLRAALEAWGKADKVERAALEAALDDGTQRP